MPDIDPIMLKAEVVRASRLSAATVWREQRAGRFPPFERLSARLAGLRLSTFKEWQNGRRDWTQHRGKREREAESVG